MLLYCEGRTPAQQAQAREILFLLWNTYPNNPWNVRIDDKIFMVSNGKFDPTWKMIKTGGTFDFSASALKKEVIMKAGEWLERAHLSRARNVNTEDDVKILEGAEEDRSPPVSEPVILDYTGSPLRTEPRPQALRKE